MKAALFILDGKKGQNYTVITRQEPNAANWKKIIDQVEHLDLEPVEVTIWDLILDEVATKIGDMLIEKAKEHYAKHDPQKLDFAERWLRAHKGKTIFYRKWEF